MLPFVTFQKKLGARLYRHPGTSTAYLSPSRMLMTIVHLSRLRLTYGADVFISLAALRPQASLGNGIKSGVFVKSSFCGASSFQCDAK